MAMNALENLAQVLETDSPEVLVDADLIPQALIPLQRMLDFAKAKR